MPYKITLHLVGGETLRLQDISHDRTPQVGDRVFVATPAGTTYARIRDVQIHPSKSPGTAVETVDDVYADQE